MYSNKDKDVKWHFFYEGRVKDPLVLDNNT